MATKSDNTQGNPYHDESGKFTSADGGDKASVKSSADASFNAFMEKLKAKKGVVDQTSESVKKVEQQMQSNLNKSWQKEYEEMQKPKPSKNEQSVLDWMFGQEKSAQEKPYAEKTEEEKEQAQLSAAQQTLANLTGIGDEALKLSDAECIKVADAYKELANEAQTIDTIVAPLNKTPCVGIWKTPVYPSDYNDKKESGSIEKKYNFYKYDYKGSEEEKQKYLDQLDQFVKDGEAYNEAYEKAKAPFAQYHKTVDEFNKNYSYSQGRKDAAKLITADTDSQEIKQTESRYLEETLEWSKQMDKEDPAAKQAIIQYTGAYSSVNNPLRDHEYPHKQDYPSQSKGYQSDFTKRVMAMDRGIVKKGGLKSDITVRRGISKLTVANLGGGGWDVNQFTTQKQLDTLIGTSFKDNAFVSCGGSSQTGFSGYVELKIFCPKGIEMAYVKPISKFAHENEFIINRGYTYKITNAYKKGNVTVIECDCLLGSNKDRYDEEQLNILAQKHF